MADHQTCETCRFHGRTGTQYFECRRHAPIARDEANRLGGVIEAHWPMVQAHEWCGDHERTPSPQSSSAAHGEGAAATQLGQEKKHG